MLENVLSKDENLILWFITSVMNSGLTCQYFGVPGKTHTDSLEGH